MPETEEQQREVASGVTVEIYDQTYRLRGEDPAYVQRLAEIVDGKMRAVSAQSNTVDSLRVAVLAALNIADECARLEDRCRRLGAASDSQASLRTRARNLSGFLDTVLDDRRLLG
jgi:cell division protein ZapA